MDTNRPQFGHNAARDGTDFGTAPAQKRGRRTEAQRTIELNESLPPGIKIGMWTDGRRKPWFVRWGKDRKVESFTTEMDRNDAAEKLAGAKETEGSAVLTFDATAWREWLAFRARCPAPLHELEALWAGRGGVRTGMTVTDAIARYKALRLAEGMVEKSDTHRHVKLHLERFEKEFGPLALDALTADLIREWLSKLKHPDNGNPMSSLTRRHHRKDVNTFLKRCVNEEWCAKNPCEKVVPPKIEEEDKEVLTARQIFDLLHFNRDEPVIGRMAFELFGGLRCSSVERLMPEHVKRDAKGIRLPGVLHKSAKTKFRQGHPDVLWAWFDHVGERMWTEVSQKNYDEKKRDAFLRARVPNTGNVLRSSFASYLLAVKKSVPEVSYLMQHRKTTTTEIYEGVADENDAKLVLAMTPAGVAMTWEAFTASQAYTQRV